MVHRIYCRDTQRKTIEYAPWKEQDMIRLSQIKLDIDKTEADLKKSILKGLRISPDRLLNYKIVKKSIDARKKQELKYIYSVDVEVQGEEEVISRQRPNVSLVKDVAYEFLIDGTDKEQMKDRPVIIGTGPAGIFCGLMLAEAGYKPILLERGDKAEDRVATVEEFWNGGALDTESNVQFGEGGAGTFSDGKLNTLVKDPSGRNKKVLETLVRFGAPKEILYLNKPHIGTDKLRNIVVNMRKQIIALGGEVKFRTRAEDFRIENNRITGINAVFSQNGAEKKECIPCEVAVLAIGHSARDTFTMLYEKGVEISAKSFAIGLRIEHSQELISKNQYGAFYKNLPPADYKLTHQAKNGRSVYSFCMCPGGFVVDASSEKGKLAVNGMSNYCRGEKNANSALIVTVTPEDFEGDSPLAGIEFQRKWEEQAYLIGGGQIPVQLWGDFKHNRPTALLGEIIPNIKGSYTLSNLKDCLPDYVSEALEEGIEAFDKKIHGFAHESAVLTGVESRTSSPVRIIRDEDFESNKKGLYPCGEGAGYAGGITSAAMDGIKIAEAIARKYKF